MSVEDVTPLGSRPELVPDESAPVISRQTKVAGALMLLALAAGIALDYAYANASLDGERGLVLAGLTLVPLAIAGVMLPVALSFGAGSVRSQWVLFSVGMLSFGLGNAVFIALYVITGSDPYPSIAEVFTLFGYVCYTVGLFWAVRAHRRLLDIRRPLAIAFAVALLGMLISYFAVIGPFVIFAPIETQPLVTRIFNTLYLVLDAFVLLMPAVALGMLASKFGKGRVAWPWWFAIGSATTLAITDTVFAYTGYIGTGRTPLIDSGYALAPMLMGIAVLVARDVYRS